MSEIHEIIERAKKEWESTVDVIADGVALYERATLNVLRVNWTLAKFLSTTPHKLVNTNIHSLICDCNEPGCPILNMLSYAGEDFLEIEQKDSGKQWALSTYPIHSSGEQPARNALVVHDISQEREWRRKSSQFTRNASLLRTIASLAEQTGAHLNTIQTNLNTAVDCLPTFRKAYVDYRVALQTNNELSKPDSSLTWEAIEGRHNVEFALLDLEQLLRQTSGQLDEVFSAIHSLSKLRNGGLNLHPADFNALVENTLYSIWDVYRKSFPIECYYGRLPLVLCDELRLQTALGDFLRTLANLYRERAQLKLVTRATTKSVNLLMQILPNQAELKNLDAKDIQKDWRETELQMQLEAVISTVAEQGGRLMGPEETQAPFHFTLTLPAADEEKKPGF